jgi:hypothetical protein
MSFVTKYQQHIDNLVSWYVNGVFVQHIVLPKQYAPTYHWQPCNNLLMPIVKNTRLSDNKQTNLRGKIRELFVVYYSTCVNRVFSKSYIRNQYTVIDADLLATRLAMHTTAAVR